MGHRRDARRKSGRLSRMVLDSGRHPASRPEVCRREGKQQFGATPARYRVPSSGFSGDLVEHDLVASEYPAL